MADCYSIAAADAALAAALLAYYTSAQVDALLVDYRTGTARTRRPCGRVAGLLHLGASGRPVGRLPHRCWPTGRARTRTFLQPTKSPPWPGSLESRRRPPVSLSNWTVRPSSGCSVVLAEHRGRNCAHLQLDARPRAPLRLPVPAWHGLQLRGAHVRGRQRLRPPVRQLRG